MDYPEVNVQDPNVEVIPYQPDDNVVAPPYKTPTPPMSQEGASKEAFYAVSSESKDPVTDFPKVQAELQTKGQSDIVDAAKKRWEVEQDSTIKQTLSNILSDTTIDEATKSNIISKYAASEYKSTDIRDRFMLKQAATDTSVTPDDRIAQDNVASNLAVKAKEMKDKEREEQHRSFISDIFDYAKAGLHLANSFSTNIPAGLSGIKTLITSGDIGKAVTEVERISGNMSYSPIAGYSGLYNLIKERDPDKANLLLNKTISDLENYLKDPKKIGVKQATENIQSVMSKLSIPSQWVGDKIFGLTNSPALSTAGQIVLDPVNLIGGRLLGKGRAYIKEGSAADALIKSNPKNASTILEAAIKDPTNKVAEALGTTKGGILEDTILPKVPDEILKENPDLAAKIISLDTKADYSFDLHRLDPNIVDVEARQKDLDSILAITKETGSPYFQQANSTITSPGINVYEGKATYGRNDTSGYVTLEGTEYALEKLRGSVDTLPEELRGTINVVEKNGEAYLEHTWRKEYSPLDDIMFGHEAVNSHFLGIPINNLKHSAISKFLFSTGIFPKVYEQGKARSVNRGAKQANDITRIIDKDISRTPFKQEMYDLVTESNKTGQEYYTKAELGSRYPKLSTKQIDELQTTHTVWRRVAHYNYRILNDNVHGDLSAKGYNSVFDENQKFVADVHQGIDAKEASTIKEVHDFSTGKIKPAAKYIEKEGKWYDPEGRQLVRLHEPINSEFSKHNYALLDPKHKIDVLRANPLPRISGWSPIHHSNHFYIDAIPKTLFIDGIKISDPAALARNRKTLSGATTKYEAQKIAESMKERYHNHDVVYRNERLDTMDKVVEQYQTSAELYAHARKRGEGIENTVMLDPLQSLIQSSRAIARNNVSLAWEQDTQKSFIKSFKDLLTDGRFPNQRSDIKLPPLATELQRQEYKAAIATYENYARFHKYGYATDTAYKQVLYKVADALESIHIPANLIRDFSKHEFPLVAVPRKIGSLLYISLNVPRQWLIQPQQVAELIAIHPSGWFKSVADLAAVHTNLIGTSSEVGKLSKIVNSFSHLISPTDKVTLDAYSKAIRDSGIIDSIDSNVLVHGVLHDTHKLITGAGDKVESAIKSPYQVANKVGRSLGYDPSELLNKVGIWLQVRSYWEKQNPGKSWNTPKVLEDLAHSVDEISGSMTKAGNLPYQTGALSPIFQFAAINHKMFMNVMQDTATSLTTAQRLRLSTARLAMNGVRYGFPAGGLIYAYIDKYGSPELQQNADSVKTGISDHLVNEWINAYYPSDRNTKTDLNIGKSFSQYGDSGLPYADVIMESFKLIDGKENTNPRYPAFGVANNLNTLYGKWETLWYSPDYSSTEKLDIGIKEGLMVSGGYNNWIKAQHIIGTGEKLTKLGNPNGLTYTVAEGYAQIFGITSNKDEWAYNQLDLFKNNEQNIKDTAKEMYTQISYLDNVYNPDGTPVDKLRQMSNFLNVSVNNQSFTPEMKQKVMEEIVNLSMKETDIKKAVIMKWVMESHQLSKQSEEKAMFYLEKDPSPEMQSLAKAMKERNL